MNITLTGWSRLTLFSIKPWSTDKSSQPDGNSSHPTSFSAVFIISANFSICRSWHRSVFKSFDCLQKYLHFEFVGFLCKYGLKHYLFISLPLPFTPFITVNDDAIVPFSISLVCFSWHSFIEDSNSVSRNRNQSTVKLSTVSEFGCSLLPKESLSSMRDWSNWKTIGAAGEVLE